MFDLEAIKARHRAAFEEGLMSNELLFYMVDHNALIAEVERLRKHIDRWVRGPRGEWSLSTLTKPPTKEELDKHRHSGIGYCTECAGAMALWPCPIEVQKGWKE